MSKTTGIGGWFNGSVVDMNSNPAPVSYVYRYGNVVSVGLNNMKFLASGPGQILFSGLPSAVAGALCSMTGSTLSATASFVSSGEICYMNTTGTQVRALISPDYVNDVHNIGFTYVCN